VFKIWTVNLGLWASIFSLSLTAANLTCMFTAEQKKSRDL
jgi:hypothetical protein